MKTESKTESKTGKLDDLQKIICFVGICALLFGFTGVCTEALFASGQRQPSQKNPLDSMGVSYYCDESVVDNGSSLQIGVNYTKVVQCTGSWRVEVSSGNLDPKRKSTIRVGTTDPYGEIWLRQGGPNEPPLQTRIGGDFEGHAGGSFLFDVMGRGPARVSVLVVN